VARTGGTEEFVRFYVSYDDGTNWLDQGIRSITVSDSKVARPLSYDVILRLAPTGLVGLSSLRPKVRAILSWNSPPPAGTPKWTPVWGNVAESGASNDARTATSSVRLKSEREIQAPESILQESRWEAPMPFAFTAPGPRVHGQVFPNSKTDPHHRFLSYVFARAARRSQAQTVASMQTTLDLRVCTPSNPPFAPAIAEARCAAAF
jgi:hypothetical protein